MPRQTQVSLAPAYAAQGRVTREPRHNFSLKTRPFGIYPFLIAPVLPGETLTNLLIQARTVSKPLKAALTGWWLDYLICYVKISDLDPSDTGLKQMFLDPTYVPPAGLITATRMQWHHTYAGSIKWVEMCLQKVVVDHFRNEDETWDYQRFVTDTSNIPIASVANGENWMNSMVSTAQSNPNASVVVGADDTLTGGEIDQVLKQWQVLRAYNLTEMSYEDYLRTHGVRSQRESEHITEIIRISRDWSYPTNTVEPTTGVPSSAVVWSTQDRADKARYFSEPGFIFGVQVARPKIVYRYLKGAGVGMMDNSLSWLPALYHDQTDWSLKHFAEGQGPVPTYNTSTDQYTVDVRDLLIYGDQFVNYDMDLAAADEMGRISLPTSSGRWRYPSEDQVDAFFKGTTDGTKHLSTDGVVTMSIRGRQTDTTPLAPAVPVVNV